jgi:preprotein translocase subunit YajC
MNSLKLFMLLGGFGGGGGGGEGAAGGGSFVTTLIPFALIIVIFYFFIIRPQNKKQKETQKMLGNLKKGDRVVTIGGLHGVIQSVKESTVVLKVDENTKMEYSRSAISSVTAEGKGDKEEKRLESKDASKEDGEDKDGE